MGQEDRDPFYSLFHITQEPGFKIIAILMLSIILIGLIAAFTVYRKNLNSGRIMSLGAILIAFSIAISHNSGFGFLMPALDLYLLLIGLAVLFVGVCWRKPTFEKAE